MSCGNWRYDMEVFKLKDVYPKIEAKIKENNKRLWLFDIISNLISNFSSAIRIFLLSICKFVEFCSGFYDNLWRSYFDKDVVYICYRCFNHLTSNALKQRQHFIPRGVKYSFVTITTETLLKNTEILYQIFE